LGCVLQPVLRPVNVEGFVALKIAGAERKGRAHL
jgi:hypothetical protein